MICLRHRWSWPDGRSWYGHYCGCRRGCRYMSNCGYRGRSWYSRVLGCRYRRGHSGWHCCGRLWGGGERRSSVDSGLLATCHHRDCNGPNNQEACSHRASCPSQKQVWPHSPLYWSDPGRYSVPMIWSASSWAISSWDRPSRFPKTCSLCSPRQLAGMRMLRGVSENFHTTPG